jgi:hypothetical protein
MKTCDIRLNTISDMQKRGAIDTALTIVDRSLFNQLNDKYSDLARTKYNVTNQGSLFTEQVKEVPRLGNTPYNRENTKSVNKAVLNQEMFTELQTNYNLRQQGDLIFYQVTEPKQTHQTVPPDGNFMTLLTNFFNKNGFKLSMDVLKDYREFFDFKSGIDLIQKEVFLPDENFVPTKEAAVLGVTLLKKTEEFFKLSNHIKAWDQYADKKRFYIQEIKNKGKVFGNDAVEIAEMYVMYDFVENYIVPNYDKLLQADKTYRKESEIVKKLKEVSFIEKAFKYFNKMLKKLFVLKPSFQEAEGAAKKIAAEILNNSINFEIKKDYVLKNTIKLSEADNDIKIEMENKGFILTGSAMLRMLGDLYRAADEVINDLDFIMSYQDFKKLDIDLAKMSDKELSQVPEDQYIKKISDAISEKLGKEYIIKKAFVGSEHKGNKSVTLTYTKGNTVVDVFVRTSSSYAKEFENNEKIITDMLTNKLLMAKGKHITDYLYFRPKTELQRARRSPSVQILNRLSLNENFEMKKRKLSEFFELTDKFKEFEYDNWYDSPESELLTKRNDELLKKIYTNLGKENGDYMYSLIQNELEVARRFAKPGEKNPGIKLSRVIRTMIPAALKNGIVADINFVDEKVDQGLDAYLTNWAKKYNIDIKNIKEFADAQTISLSGAVDVINKIIYLANSEDRNVTTMAEEVATMMVFMMGTQSFDIKSGLKQIKNYPKYDEEYLKYSKLDRYKEKNENGIMTTNVNKINIEILTKAIAERIVVKYKARTSDNPFWKEVDNIINWFVKIFKGKRGLNLDVILDKLAEDILSEDSQIIKPLPEDYELKTYEQTLAENPQLVELLDALVPMGFVPTGSLSYRNQLDTYRGKGEKIHDLDLTTTKFESVQAAIAAIQKVFPDFWIATYISPSTREEGPKMWEDSIKWTATGYYGGSFIGKIGEDFTIEMTEDGREVQHTVKNIATGEILKEVARDAEGNVYGGGVLIDLFVEKDRSQTVVVDDKGLAHYVLSYDEKLKYGREKDARDLVYAKNRRNVDLMDNRYIFYQVLGDEQQQQQQSFQLENMPMSEASASTIEKIKEACKKMGIKIETLVEYAKKTGLDTKTINGVADLVRGIVAIAEGKEGVSLTEEMVHLATAILEQTNPKMVTEMIAKIDRFKIYKQTLEAYKNNKAYQLPNGKPDIRKIKKEAVDKLIAELIINESEGSTEFPELREEINRSLIRRIWDGALDAIRGMYKSSNVNIFETAARQIGEGQVGGTVNDIVADGVFFQLSDVQKEIQTKLLTTKNAIDKVLGDPDKADPLLLDSEEANNFYEMTNADGTKLTIAKRVTDRVKAWYKERFGNKTFTPQEQAFNELKRKFGVEGHADLEEIHDRYYNKDGTKRDKPGARPKKFNLPSEEMYSKLETYYKDLIKTFPKDTLIMSEVIIYDQKEKEAGTLDFLAIEPSGKAHILDWKFMHIKGDDVAWFKQGAFNIQLGRYKQMLKDNYGIKEFGMTRAIPISMEFKPKNKFDISLGFRLSGIAIGSAKASDIEELHLVPISEETESTGEKDLDKLIVQLNALLRQIEKEEVTENEREFKIERLNTLRQTIRVVQATGNIVPLIDTIEVMRKEGDRLINDYEITYKNRPASSKDSVDKDLSDFSDDMNNFIALSELFANVGREVGHLIYSEKMKAEAKTKKQKEELADREDAFKKLNEEGDAIYRTRNEIKEISLAFADKHIGQRNLVTGLTRPEAVVKGLSSLFRGVSDLPLASLNLLYKITRLAQGKASQDALVEVKEIMAIRESIMNKGQDVRSFIQKIYQKDEKGGLVNKLIYKYKDEFRKTVDEKFAAGGDRRWLLANIDVEGYKKEALPVITNRVNQIKKQSFPGTDAQVKAKKKQLIEEVLLKYDITRVDFTGGDNYIIKRHPLPIWYSDAYKVVESDSDLLKLYNFITVFNEKAKDVGYINNNVMKTFLPFVRKTMAEKIAFDNILSVMDGFGNSLQINVDEAGYGKINEITGALENSIPKYYTHDFSRTETGVNDYSDVSEDLFKNLILYVQQVNKYKYMTEVEGQLKLVKTVEEFKGYHLQTNKSGDVVMDKNNNPEKVKGNEENTRMYDDFLRVLLYDQKYVLSDADTPLKLGKVLNFIKGGVNKVAGREIWKENEEASPTSLIKTMDAANRGFQIKTLGLEIIPGLVNLFGGQAQMSAQSGNYFKYREFLKNERVILSQEFKNDEDKEIFIQMMDLFMPMKDDPAYEEYKKAGISKLTNSNLGDMLMVTMRYPEQIMEKATFLTLLENSMVVDGKIVNIREYVKRKYKGRSSSSSAYKNAKVKIEQEVENLKSTKSIAVTRKLVDGKLEIPGLDTSDRVETQRLTNLTRRISRNAMGGVSDGDVNRMSMSIWTKSMMVFKGWIPKLADTRFSELRKISDDFSVEIGEDGMAIGEKYDMGRLRLLGYVMMNSFRDKSSNIINILEMNDAGIEAIDKLYLEFAESYKKRTVEEFTMTKDDFTDMVRNNLRNQLKELAVLASLIGATLAVGFMEPPEDADKATKNFYRYTQKVIDKFVSEISFFYNPLEFEKILSGSMFPAIGLITDMTKFIKHFWLQTTGLDFDPETSFDDVRKKAQPIKYAAKSLPVFKSVMTYLAIISSDFAKEFDITIQKESSIR